jgi:hypothetical protein
MRAKSSLILAVSACLSGLPVWAQEDSSSGSGFSPSSSGSSGAAAPAPLPAGLPADYSAGATVTTGTNGQPLLPEGNPLSGLFTPQPQYVTPQTTQNHDPVIPAGSEKNPIGGLFTNNFQQGKASDAPDGTNNMLKGVFTGQNPYQTPQAQQNPDGQAKYAVPGYGQAKFEDMVKSGVKFGPHGPETDEYGNVKPEAASPPALSGGPASAAKDAKDPKDDKDAKDGKDTKLSDKDKKDKDKDKDKDKKDEKAGDKKAEDGKDGDKKDTAAAADKDDKDAAKDKDDKDKETAKEDEKPVQLGPYDPMKDALFLLQNGKARMAQDALTGLLKTQPQNAQAHYLSAVSLVQMREFQRAAEEYRMVLQLVPTSPLAQLAIDGLKKIGMPAQLSTVLPGRLPPLRQR